jgi:fructose-1,6-bisphosphatase/inositol monophosphatase family enzyme
MDTTMKQYSDFEILELICAAEREGAALIMQASDVLAECKTGHKDVVTQYDRRVQELLVERLSSAVESARFFCEENDRQDDLNAEHVFIIDPIDGTMNFVRGLNHSCISVAYMSRGKLRAAAVDVASAEPIPAASPLLTAPNCIITPHMAWAPKESRQRILDCTAQSIRAYLSGSPVNVVNP